MMSGYLWVVVALVSGFQIALSSRYQTSRQISYYVYPSNRVISGPNVCKSTCCQGWQLNAYTGRCTKAICRPLCRNGGQCIRPNQCSCQSGYYGSYCQYEAYVRPNTGSGSRALTGSSSTVYRPASSTTVLRPASSSTSSSSRTYVSRIRPATSGTRTYALTYHSGRGNVISQNGQYAYPASPSGAQTSSQSASGSGLSSSPTLARFTMRGPCFRRVDSSSCEAPLSDVTTLHDDCCATVGQGWGNRCYACPQVLGRELSCSKGLKKSPDTGKCIDVDECTAFDGICMHGRCLNSHGSYRCRCDDGYMSDTTGTQCLESVKQMCYTRVINNQCYGASGSRVATTQMQCCCSLGAAWGTSCQKCPRKGSAAFRAMCPQGTGYHYMPSNGYNHVSTVVNSDNPQPTQHLDACQTNSRLCLNGQCVNTGNGAYRCECSRGFRLSSRGDQCIDINECRETRDICSGGRCLNSYGSYHCICAQGLVRRGGTCEDIDECTARSTNPCVEYACLNTIGSFHCSSTECSDGYRFDVSFHRCVDENECEREDVCQLGRCINMEGSFRCICSKGFILSDSGADCIDVDECGQSGDIPLCGDEATCVNEVGSYRCICPVGSDYDSDARTCQSRSQGGQQEFVEAERKDCYGSISDLNFCSNMLGSNITQEECCCTIGAGWGDDCDLMVCPSQGSAAYNETCPVGKGKHVITQRRPVDAAILPVYPEAGAVHESRGQVARIQGINECEIFPGVCGSASCVDQEVLFDCQCQAGYKFDDEQKSCIVRDFCVVFEGRCGNGTCENSEGTYICKCPSKYRFDSSLRACIAINHCASPSICGNGTCLSTDTGPECSCPTGFRFNRNLRTCAVHDHCLAYGSQCGNGTCRSIIGGYTCICPPGHRFSERSRTCEVTNFCVTLNGVCGNGTCLPTLSSYLCRCPSGYQFDPTEGYCKDIDLCQIHSILCGNATCVDLGSTINCLCPSGFRFVSSSKACLDIDECTSVHSCGSEATCVNSHGSHHCACPDGFEFNARRRTCDDINECRQTPGICGNATCVNTEGSYQCQCDYGFTYDETSVACLDSNECAEYRGICRNGTCVNTQGSYRCECPTGYEYISGNGNGCLDINECSATLGICGDATCQNMVGSYQCRCNQGYTFNAQQRLCNDVNECQTSTDVCGNGRCENTRGSFRCVCAQGSQFDETRRQCIAVEQPYESHTTSRDPDTLSGCLTPDVCGNGTCSLGAQGDAVCTCETGFMFDSNIKGCVDIDECEQYPDVCGQATCRNMEGSFSCDCPEGYIFKKKRRTCVDFNECRRYHSICTGGRCVNKKGTFMCICPPGEQYSYSTRRCVAVTQVDACSRNPGVCGNGTCSSAGHSISCHCPTGYDYNPSAKQCQATNECDTPNRCGSEALCVDTASSYRCICPTGYVYQSQDRSCREIPKPPPRATGAGEQVQPPSGTLVGPTKRGPNECNTSPCINGVCVDTPEGFQCQCTQGYQLVDSVTCEDINECESPNADDMCMFGTCVNEPLGSYTCECTPPLTLDSTGRRCIELLGPVAPGDMTPVEEPLGTCWGPSGPGEDICSNALSEGSGYQQCCCGTGISWGEDCFACPLRDTEDYQRLCVPMSTFDGHDVGTNLQVRDQSVRSIPRT